MAVRIKGVIGWDVNGQEFADKISRMSGDITFEIDSPGGSVFHGISIFNAIKNYDRGKCRMHVVGDCSSMAAYIMLAGDGPVEFEPNSIVVLHNPWSFAVGDYNAMYKEGKVLERLAALYAEEFVKKGLFEESEIRSIMDAETWFVGSSELKKLGKVLGEDENQKDDKEDAKEDVEIKVAAFRERIEEAKVRLKALKSDDYEKIVAMLPQKEIEATIQQKESKKEIEKTVAEQPKGVKKMVQSLEELKAQKPSIYNEAKSEGQKEEQKRVASLMKFIDVDKQAVIKAINDGVGINDDEFQASILAAKVNKNELKAMEDENPPAVDPKTETHAPEDEQSKEPDAEAQEQAKEDEKLAKILEAMGIKQDK